jgi:hypothetical protein
MLAEALAAAGQIDRAQALITEAGALARSITEPEFQALY